MRLEKIMDTLGTIISAGALVLAIPDYADAKVTQVDRRRDGTIVRIYDDEDPEGYLYPIRFCDKCREYHADMNKRKVELQFQTKSGRIVDYPPVGDPDDSNLLVQPPIIQDNPPIIQQNPPVIFPITPYYPYEDHQHHHNHQGHHNNNQQFIPNNNNFYRTPQPPPQKPGHVTYPAPGSSGRQLKRGFLLGDSYITNKNKPSIQNKAPSPSQQQNRVSPPQRQGFMPSNKYIPSKNLNKK